MIKIDNSLHQDTLAKVLHYYGLLDGEDEFKIVCPFHEDVNASMQISLHNNFFYCHGCASSGDALQFVMNVNKGKDDLQACLEFYKILKSKKVEHLELGPRATKVKSEDKQALIEASDYYNCLRTVDWTKERSDERSYMLARGFTRKALNLCKAKLTYNDSYPIVFPMYDMGRLKGWVCRTMNKKIEEKRKYLYNEGFSRRSTLVGDYNSKVVVLVEGYMDWLKFRQFGVNKVAAVLGWKLTAQQINKLREQGVEVIISALDNDSCGNRGTEYAKKFFKVVRFQYPPGVKDPGDMDEDTFNKANETTKKIYKEALKNGFSR